MSALPTSWNWEHFKGPLEAALKKNLPFSKRRPPMENEQKLAAVLVLFGNQNGKPSLLITRRTETVETHKGQMAFPGGRCDRKGDGQFETSIEAALRETYEEVGIAPDDVEICGELSDLWTVTGYLVTPVVGLLKVETERLSFVTSEHEIAEAFWVPLSVLMDPGTYRYEKIRFGEVDYPIDVFQVADHRIWGATGSMIKNLLDRLQSV